MINNHTPEVRFNEFNASWEQRKLGELVSIKSGWSPSNFTKSVDQNSLLFIKVDDLNYSSREQMKSHMKVQENPRFVKIKKGSTIFPKRGAAIMTNKVRILGSDGYMDTNMMALEPEYVNGDFLYTFIARTGLYKIADTSTLPQINNKHIEPYAICLPVIEEQEKVGNFFHTLDSIIAFHQQELTTFKQTKQGFLQKMFPKAGESVPELRFPGFTGDWEQCKIGEITESYSGGTPSAGNKLFYGGNIPFIRSAEINSESTELFITEDGLKNSSAKIVEEGDILYALYGATSGEVGISKINGAINQAILAMKPKFEHDSYFITQWFKKQKNTIVNTYLQGGQGNLSGSIVKDLMIPIPNNKDEQKSIGRFFKQLDDTIALHQRELDALKETKKAFLQKMFV